jgi:hypothetical protein
MEEAQLLTISLISSEGILLPMGQFRHLKIIKSNNRDIKSRIGL